MIDEKKLIEKIQNGIKASNTEHDNYMTGLRNGMRWCLSLVDGKEPIFEKCNSWIPCEERLPSEKGFYQVTCEWEGKLEVYDLWYGNGEWLVDEDEGEVFQKVIAWQPLPAPYKKEGNSDAG